MWRRPSPPLRGLVAGYVGYRQRLAVPAVHRGIPSVTLPLVIDLGPAMTIEQPGSGRAATTVTSFVAGLHDRYVLIDTEEHHGVQVDLGPVAAHLLLDQPLGELAGETVPLEAVFGSDADRLVDDLACADGWPARFDRLDRELTARLQRSRRRLDAEVVHAFDLIRTSRGQVRVGRLAEATGWSERRLSRRLHHAVGLPPKRLARLTRLEHVMGLLTTPDGSDLATIAATAGFYDQAHLANEVRHYTGLSPTALLARRLPDAGSVFDVEAASV